jgi:hypothetical protein
MAYEFSAVSECCEDQISGSFVSTTQAHGMVHWLCRARRLPPNGSVQLFVGN